MTTDTVNGPSGRDLLAPELRSQPSASAAEIMARLAWGAALVAIGLTLLMGFAGMATATGAPQQAASAGQTCFILIGIYAGVRAFDEMITARRR